MKTKTKLLLALLFLSVVALNAQPIESTESTGFGISNGANINGTGGAPQSTYVGYEAGNRNGANANTFIGYKSGRLNKGSANNTFLGAFTGAMNDGGSFNVFVGTNSGINNTLGGNNVFVGNWTGHDNTTGTDNVFIGNSSGSNNITGLMNSYVGGHAGAYAAGTKNTFVGYSSGRENDGNNNTFIGVGAGAESKGSGNVLIGTNVALSYEIDNKLYIDNEETDTPLVWGDFAANQVKLNGKVGIGNGFGNFPTTAGAVNVSNYNLFVKGGILTEEVRISLQSTWADYVFNKDYNLLSLKDIESFINKNGHLPNVPSAKQVAEEGIALGEMTKIQQEKIEELTLYLIKQNKEIEELKEQVRLLLNKKQ